MRNNLEIGKPFIHSDTGLIAVMQESTHGYDDIIASSRVLQSICLSEPCEVLFNGDVVGSVYANNYNEYSGVLVLHFRLANHGDMNAWLQDHQSEMIGVSTIYPEKLRCPACQNIYTRGQSSCYCIQNYNYVMVEEGHISALALYDASQGLPVLNCRSDILRQFFGGPAGNIWF